MNSNIYIIGFMGTGKTTVSKALAKVLHVKRIDVDEWIVKQQKMQISKIFENFGEDYFRDIETSAFHQLEKEQGAIISCGGGAVLKEENVRLMKASGKIVLLTASPKTIYNRVKGNDKRPVLKNHMSPEGIETLMKKREAKYLAAADVVIDTDFKSVDTICDEIIDKIMN